MLELSTFSKHICRVQILKLSTLRPTHKIIEEESGNGNEVFEIGIYAVCDKLAS